MVFFNGRVGNGLIPAGAGNITEQLLGTPHLGAHPRGCGEHVYQYLR